MCGAARCGEHGTCAAKYLGASSPLPVTSEQACICDSGWSGPLCTFNPCLGQGKTCSGNGQCVASDISTAFCECNPGFSGENCAISCNEVCPGHYPFGCSDDIDNVTKYGCNTGGACSYLKDGESYPYSGFCTFKSNSETNICQCTHNDCELPGQCTNGQCSKTIPKEDNTPCNSVPFGICRSGICTVTNGPSTSPPNPAPPNPAVELVAAAPPNPAANPAAESNATAPPQNRRRPPKKPKGKLSRSKRGGKQKHSSYNHAHARQACGLGPTAPSQQITSAISQATSNPIPQALRSPPEKALKKKAKQLEKRTEGDKRKIDQLERKEVSRGNMIKKLKDEKTDLLKQLRAERHASNT